MVAFVVGGSIGLWQIPTSSPERIDVALAPPDVRTPAPIADDEPPAIDDPTIPAHRFIAGELVRGETLAASLQFRGISAEQVHEIVQAMSPVFNFRYARPGDRYRLVLSSEGQVARFRYERSPIEHYEVLRDDGTLVASRHQPELIRRRARLAGVVTSSLYDAVRSLGEAPELAHDFADIFAWDVDFSRSVQPGDEFSILYERLFLKQDDGSESYVRPGQILAGRYTTIDAEHRALYFETAESSGGYYRPDGSSVQRQFLQAPLHYRRISSNFTHSRLHPILKVRRPHLGIDYAAPTGTPVWAVADGKVVTRSYQGGFGNLVKVRHANGYVSYYAHLSRFSKELRVGQRVHQKQVVGYVGSTGLSTGPHLDFRLKKDGRYVNPSRLRTPAGDPIPDGQRDRFKADRDALLAGLDPSPLVITNEAL